MFMVTKLCNLNILQTRNLEDLSDGICCDPKLKDCAYDECSVCKHNVPPFNNFAQTELVKVVQWRTLAEPMIGQSGEKIRLSMLQKGLKKL